MNTVSTKTHPATLWQKFLLSRVLDPLCSPEFDVAWVLSVAINVRPYVDLRRLQRAFNKLAKRHDNLRSRFVEERGTWRVIIDDSNDIVVKIMDIGDLDELGFKQKINELSCAPLPILSQHLAEVILVKCGQHGDVIITRVHHAISDGYGMIVLAEDLLKYLIGFPVLGKAVGHAEYVAKWQSPRGQRKASVDKFWKDKLSNFPKAPMIGRKAKGLDPLVRTVGLNKTKALSIELNSKSVEALDKRSESLSSTNTTMLYTGFMNTLCQVYDQERIAFSFSPSRTEKELDTFAGDHTLDPICIYQHSGAANIEQQATRMKSEIMEALSNLPADAARSGSEMDDEIIAKGGYPRQFIAYVARAKNREKRSMFSGGFSAKAGQVQKLGPFDLTKMELNNGVLSISELQFEVNQDCDGTAFNLGFDAEAYTSTEVKTIANKICNVLDLEPKSMVEI